MDETKRVPSIVPMTWNYSYDGSASGLSASMTAFADTIKDADAKGKFTAVQALFMAELGTATMIHVHASWTKNMPESDNLNIRFVTVK